MSTPEDPRQEGEGGWQPQGWQSEWQRPGGWRREPDDVVPPPPQASGGWQQTPDGAWAQVGARQTSGKSTAALVLGILGLVLFCPFICSILALIFGYQARREIDASGGRLGGRGNAVVGIVLGWIGVALLAAFVVLIVIGLAVGDSSSSTPPPVQVSPA
jgi:Domain of unknown function (DUF4190)